MAAEIMTDEIPVGYCISRFNEAAANGRGNQTLAARQRRAGLLLQ